MTETINATAALNMHHKHGDSYGLTVKFLDDDGAAEDKSSSTIAFSYWTTTDMSGSADGTLTIDDTNDTTGIFVVSGLDALAIGTYYCNLTDTISGSVFTKFDIKLEVSDTFGSGGGDADYGRTIIVKDNQNIILVNQLGAVISSGGTEFADDQFRIQDNGDATKEIAFQASGITTSTTRTITMPDADVDLGDIGTVTPEFADNVFRIQNSGDATKEIDIDASAITTATTRTIIMPDADVNLGVLPYNYYGWSPILDTKPTPDTEDDEFEGGAISGEWTVVNGTEAAVDLLETGNVSRYDVDTRPGWLLMQVGNNSSQSVTLRQDYSIGDGESIVCCFSYSYPMLGNNATQPDIGLSDMHIGVRLNNNDTSPSSGDNLYYGITLADQAFQLTISESTTGDYIEYQQGRILQHGLIYLRFSRDGANIYTHFSFNGGSTWVQLGDYTHTNGAWASVGYDNVWIFCETPNNFDRDALVPIQAFQFFRLGSDELDPW